MLQHSTAMYSFYYVSWLHLVDEYGGCMQPINLTSPLRHDYITESHLYYYFSSYMKVQH